MKNGFERCLIYTSLYFKLDYKIIDLSGRSVKEGSAFNGKEFKISSNELENGIYFIELLFENNVIASAKTLISK